MAHTGLSTSQPADTDDDNDGELDTAEAAGCELIADCDGDGYLDGSDAFDLDNGAWTDTDGDGLADDIIAAGSGFEFDFEDGTLPADFDSTSTWTVTDASLDGDYSAQAATITHSESTSLVLTLYTGEGTMSFDWGVSSEQNWDELWFYVDGTAVFGGNAYSGTTTVYDTTSPNYYATSSGTVYWLCDNADLSNGVSIGSDVVYLSWVNDGYSDCNDGSDEGATSFVSTLPVTCN